MRQRPLQLIRETFPDDPTLDHALSRAVLMQVAEGSLPDTIRVWKPDRCVAFSARDARDAVYGRAREAALSLGFAAVERLAGGRAAVFHPGTVAIAWARSESTSPAPILQRFEECSTIVALALQNLGVDARVGQVPGEYCPGDHSINIGGRKKVAGLGQRVTRGASHLGGVIVVEDGRSVARVLEAVYEALAIEWDPLVTGSVSEEIGCSWSSVVDSLLQELSRHYDLIDVSMPPSTLAAAQKLAG